MLKLLQEIFTSMKVNPVYHDIIKVAGLMGDLDAELRRAEREVHEARADHYWPEIDRLRSEETHGRN